MFRQLIGSEAGSPNIFSYPFPGGEVSLNSPKQLFVLSPSHIAVPPMNHMGLTISSKIPFIAPAPVTFPVPTFTRAHIATFVNSQGLIETAPEDNPRFDHDPATGAPKGLLLEEARKNVLLRASNMLILVWSCSGTSIATSMDLPIFAADIVFILIGSGASGGKNIQRPFQASATTKTFP